MTTIAVIGAGLAGLTAARLLASHAEVTVFEKSRGYGGRLATRYAKPYQFDHGAQFFKACSKAFNQFLAPMIEAGVIQRWDAKFVEIKNGEMTQQRQWGEHFPHYVGVPDMHGIGEYLQEGLDVRLNTRIQRMDYLKQRWLLTDESGQYQGEFDWVVVAIPAAQAADLLPSALSFTKRIKQVNMQSCFALMLGFEHALALPFDAARVLDGDISWISVNNSKPGRHANYALLVHSTNAWAADHIDDDRKQVLAHLVAETEKVIGYALKHAEHQSVHGWRYANVDKQVGEPYLMDPLRQIAVCGDWLIQGRVESAFLSGQALGQAMLDTLDAQSGPLTSHAA